MRIDRLLSNMGYGTRKEVKAYIKQGSVRLNGEVVKKVGEHVDVEGDVVTFLGEEVVYKEFVYYVMHKPQGVISATEDYVEHTVIDLLEDEDRHFEPFPVGRLDKDTEGLLLLTNDGQLAHRLLTPKNNVPKTYFAAIDQHVTDEDVAAFAQGVVLDDGYETKPGELVVVSNEDDGTSRIELTITEGKFHQVKRMFQSVGKEVTYLKRLSMGPLVLDDVLTPLGTYRELSDDEVNALIAYVS